MLFDDNVTNVWFKRFDGIILAIFADGYECNPHRLMSYIHFGQHGECRERLKFLPNATPEEYEELFDELISIGYRLHVINGEKNWKKSSKG